MAPIRARGRRHNHKPRRFTYRFHRWKKRSEVRIFGLEGLEKREAGAKTRKA
jgi:hypothetical protein